MATEWEWSKEVYEQSVTRLCWCWTPYDDGWDASLRWGAFLQKDDELREIVRMESELGAVPEWARKVVDGPITFVAGCGHITYPLSFRDAIRAIGTGSCLPVNHTCHTLDPNHKLRLLDLAFLLDAWLAGASAASAAEEMLYRERAKFDWMTICESLWTVLGTPTELKTLLVERFLHQLRWWVKVTVWDGDLGGGWMLDHYLGDRIPDNDLVTDNGNRQLRPLPGILQSASPRVQRWESRLAEICPDWPFFRDAISQSWPCAPKAFRFYEKLLWCIGLERQAMPLGTDWPYDGDPIPNYLGSFVEPVDYIYASDWWRECLNALDGWWQDLPSVGGLDEEVYADLGEPTPVKRWLVRLLAHRMRMLQRHSGILHKLVGAYPESN